LILITIPLLVKSHPVKVSNHMPKYNINGPDGQQARIELPDGVDFNTIDFSSVFKPAKEKVLNVTERGVNLIKGFETFQAKPYDDFGALSIGYGTRGIADPDDEITEPQADGLLRQHIKKDIIPWVKDNVKAKLEPHQLDAIVSLVYNVGTSAFGKSRALAALNEGDMDTFKREAFDKERGFTKVTKNGTKRISPGLVGRREKEEALFNGEINDEFGIG